MTPAQIALVQQSFWKVIPIAPDTAAAVGAAADKVVDATMRGVPETIPEGPATGVPAATEVK